MKLDADIFSIIDKEWALLTAGDRRAFNCMTVSWGSLGTLWGKPVATVYVRQSRYTKKFMDFNEYFTLSQFPEEYRDDLMILGRKSGRDCDKLALTKLHPTEILDGDAIAYKEATRTFVCRKLYWQEFDYDTLPEDVQLKFYNVGDSIHTMYIAEVVDIIGK